MAYYYYYYYYYYYSFLQFYAPYSCYKVCADVIQCNDRAITNCRLILNWNEGKKFAFGMHILFVQSLCSWYCYCAYVVMYGLSKVEVGVAASLLTIPTTRTSSAKHYLHVYIQYCIMWEVFNWCVTFRISLYLRN